MSARPMGIVRIIDGDGKVLCDRARVADSFGSRLVGLLGRRALPAGEGLLIRGTSSVHTHFMRFPIDVVFRDREGRVASIARDLRPWRFASCRGAVDVLELAAGACERVGVEVGASLAEEPV